MKYVALLMGIMLNVMAAFHDDKQTTVNFLTLGLLMFVLFRIEVLIDRGKQ